MKPHTENGLKHNGKLLNTIDYQNININIYDEFQLSNFYKEPS